MNAVGVEEVAGLYAVSIRKIWSMVDAGAIPRPFYLGSRTARWCRADVEADIARKSKQAQRAGGRS